MLRNGSVKNNPKYIDGRWLESVRIEEVSEVLVVIEVTMLEQEEAVDGKIDNFSERLAASLHRAEKLQQEGDFFTRKVYSEVKEVADE